MGNREHGKEESVTEKTSIGRFGRSAVAALALSAAIGLSACAQPAADPAASEGETGAEAGAVERSGRVPRIALSYDGGIMVLEAGSLELVADLPMPGFNRLNPAGDGRHVLVSTEGGWAVLDMGTWTEPHGDHSHSYTSEPVLGEVVVAADTPGHVVVHDGLTTLFDDGTGEITVVPVEEWEGSARSGEVTPSRTAKAPKPHHGVAIAHRDGRLFVTEGTEDARTGARLLDGSGKELAASDACPGVHGETVLEDGTIMVGCEDGALLLRERSFEKIDSPTAPYGRIGNAYSNEDSQVVLGDYKPEKSESIALRQISLVDTASSKLQVVDVDAEYTWRNLARGAKGVALVYGTDGALRVIDPASGQEQRRVQAGGAWKVPEEWQSPHPALVEHRGYAYASDSGARKVHAVDYVSGEVTSSPELPHAPNEMVLVTG